MAVRNKIFFKSFVITSVIFILILLLNSYLNTERETYVIGKMDSLLQQYEDMQSLLLMAEFMGDDATCIALESSLGSMNKNLWDLGKKIDSYRAASDDIFNDPFYVSQKVEFNRKEVLYFAMLNKMEEICDVDKTIVSYFYKNSDDCPDCDAQSFVLVDIKKEYEDLDKGNDIAIFSFDADMQIPTIQFLLKHHNLTEFPAVVIGDTVYGGLNNKNSMIDIICEERNNTDVIC